MSLKRRVQALIRVAPGLGFDTSPSAITLAEALIARLSAMGEILDVVLIGGSFGGYAKLSCCSGHVASASEGTPV